MTQEQKLTLMRTLIGKTDTADDSYLCALLDIAEREILAWRYSYAESTPEEVPAAYEMTQIYAAIAGYDQAGAEGQLTHTENGINRTWRYEDMISYIRGHVPAVVRVIR